MEMGPLRSELEPSAKCWIVKKVTLPSQGTKWAGKMSLEHNIILKKRGEGIQPCFFTGGKGLVGLTVEGLGGKK